MGCWLMFGRSIKRKIVSIAVGLIVLMFITSALSMIMARTVRHLLDELTDKYIPAYGHLAQTEVRTFERALALRRMIIAKMQTPPDEAAYAENLRLFREKDPKVEIETGAARKLIVSIIDDVSTPSDNVALAQIDTRIGDAVSDLRRYLNQEDALLIAQLDARDFAEARRTLARVDTLRDDFDHRIDAISANMLAQVYASAGTVIRKQQQTIILTVILTALAAILGMLLAILVSGGIARSLGLLLEGTREVEAGRLDRSIEVTTRDEVGELSAAFNRMVEQLRQKEHIRETFGRYIDPRVMEGLIDHPSTVAPEGQRRIMTVMFCDMKGFTHLSEGMTPQGLVKVMNRYLSIMSEPIRAQRGIIDKYIGDAIMAYWGPPFVEESQQARLACLAATEMISRIPVLRKELPELLGVRIIPTDGDLRVGIATGEALVGSIGSEFMMSYTVMGDAVNLAARLEVANKTYGSRCLISEETMAEVEDVIEAREIDRLVVVGQTKPHVVYEIMARKGELAPNEISLRSHYAEGLAAYRSRQWDDARRAFTAAIAVVSGDGPSQTLLQRVEKLQRDPPASDWDGSWRLEYK
jgi:class 3 adenylate cyclase